jgi:putative oxidoreductase
MSLGLLVVRLVVGLLFFGHGAQKLFGWFGGHGPEGTGMFFESRGLRPGRLMALGAGAAEAAGGISIALGLLTPLGAAVLSAVMLTAIWSVHRENGLWATQGGSEYNIVLLATVFALSGTGPGSASLDNALGIHAAGAGWALAQLGAGLLGALAMVALGQQSRGRSVTPPPAQPAVNGRPASRRGRASATRRAPAPSGRR